MTLRSASTLAPIRVRRRRRHELVVSMAVVHAMPAFVLVVFRSGGAVGPGHPAWAMRAGTARERVPRMSAPSPDERGPDAVADVDGREPVTAAQRWLARLAVLAALAAIAVLLVGGAKSIGVLISGVVGARPHSRRRVVVPEQPRPRPLAGRSGGRRRTGLRRRALHLPAIAVGGPARRRADRGFGRRRASRDHARPALARHARTTDPSTAPALRDHESALRRREGRQVRARHEGRRPRRRGRR